jgi:hypothetical protein
MLGLIAFSYGLEAHEPSICNRKIAELVARIIQNEHNMLQVVAQWEIALALEEMGYDNCHVVWPKPNSYLSSANIIDAASPIFRKAGVTQVTPVAQPFLHYPAVARQIKNAGFEIYDRGMPKIGHNPNSIQPWTRSGLALTRYALRQKLTGHEGTPILTEQIKRLLDGGTK